MKKNLDLNFFVSNIQVLELIPSIYEIMQLSEFLTTFIPITTVDNRLRTILTIEKYAPPLRFVKRYIIKHNLMTSTTW